VQQKVLYPSHGIGLSRACLTVSKTSNNRWFSERFLELAFKNALIKLGSFGVISENAIEIKVEVLHKSGYSIDFDLRKVYSKRRVTTADVVDFSRYHLFFK
jgi:hypothetical protein